jgi:hypothetical protein
MRNHTQVFTIHIAPRHLKFKTIWASRKIFTPQRHDLPIVGPDFGEVKKGFLAYDLVIFLILRMNQ